jgi:hypothetical protein
MKLILEKEGSYDKTPIVRLGLRRRIKEGVDK